jgi:hypothetical protein
VLNEYKRKKHIFVGCSDEEFTGIYEKIKIKMGLNKELLKKRKHKAAIRKITTKEIKLT